MGISRVLKFETDHPLKPFLDARSPLLRAALDEARPLLPELKARCLDRLSSPVRFCRQVLVATLDQRKKRSRRKEHSQAEMMHDEATGKDRGNVERAARAVHKWLLKEKSPLRDLLSGLSDGAAFFTASVQVRTSEGACRYRPGAGSEALPGITEDCFVRIAQGRLC